MRLVVDKNLCNGYGTCERIAPELFRLDSDQVAQVLIDGDLQPEQLETAIVAIDRCPMTAISLENAQLTRAEILPSIDTETDRGTETPSTPFETHVFVCTSGEYCPEKDGSSREVHKKFKELVKQAGLKGRVRVNNSGCLDQCGHGPMVVVYPAGVWYSHVTVDDVARIVDEHLVNGCPVESLRYHPKKSGGNKLKRDNNDLRVAGQEDGCRAAWPTIPLENASDARSAED